VPKADGVYSKIKGARQKSWGQKDSTSAVRHQQNEPLEMSERVFPANKIEKNEREFHDLMRQEKEFGYWPKR
jgi:hypothetical protein